jgi:hypothetical protein
MQSARKRYDGRVVKGKGFVATHVVLKRNTNHLLVRLIRISHAKLLSTSPSETCMPVAALPGDAEIM